MDCSWHRPKEQSDSETASGKRTPVDNPHVDQVRAIFVVVVALSRGTGSMWWRGCWSRLSMVERGELTDCYDTPEDSPRHALLFFPCGLSGLGKFRYLGACSGPPPSGVCAWKFRHPSTTGVDYNIRYIHSALHMHSMFVAGMAVPEIITVTWRPNNYEADQTLF